ncbi:hypothetical protein EBH_0083320 [Eimeria brunetti]|uniref:Uncharacterized protein n=1 Tax=Eimeria brunetti TaxID=51314 RepID=U6LGZ6_9EIME|nr:hypothetical protein EBH_0083320 [Eimeria brunetti]
MASLSSGRQPFGSLVTMERAGDAAINRVAGSSFPAASAAAAAAPAAAAAAAATTPAAGAAGAAAAGAAAGAAAAAEAAAAARSLVGQTLIRAFFQDIQTTRSLKLGIQNAFDVNLIDRLSALIRG